MKFEDVIGSFIIWIYSKKGGNGIVNSIEEFKCEKYSSFLLI